MTIPARPIRLRAGEHKLAVSGLAAHEPVRPGQRADLDGRRHLTAVRGNLRARIGHARYRAARCSDRATAPGRAVAAHAGPVWPEGVLRRIGLALTDQGWVLRIASVSGNVLRRSCFRISILSCCEWSTRVRWRPWLSAAIVTQLVTQSFAKLYLRCVAVRMQRSELSTPSRSSGLMSTSRTLEPSLGPTIPHLSSRSMSRPALANPTRNLR